MMKANMPPNKPIKKPGISPKSNCCEKRKENPNPSPAITISKMVFTISKAELNGPIFYSCSKTNRSLFYKLFAAISGVFISGFALLEQTLTGKFLSKII
jgi:hypothetical protein